MLCYCRPSVTMVICKLTNGTFLHVPHTPVVIYLHLFQSLRQFVSSNIDSFTDKGGGGVVLLIYSIMLSRGPEGIKADVDDALGGRNTLIDRHGYATQELVNLLMMGSAYSNVFDGEKKLDDASGK